MTNLFVRWAAAALFALPLAGGITVQPVLAEDDPPIEFVCFDSIIDGKSVIICEPASVIAEECEQSDLEGPECDAAGSAESRPGRTSSLSTGNAGDSGHGGDAPARLKGANALRN